MECCQEFKETKINAEVMQKVKIFFGLMLLSVGIWLAVQTGIHGQGLGYLLILASPFAVLNEEKKR
jgi:thiol:disulfide interchange protein